MFLELFIFLPIFDGLFKSAENLQFKIGAKSFDPRDATHMHTVQ